MKTYQVSYNKNEAQNNNDTTRVRINIALGTQTSVSGTDIIKDTAYDDAYYGFYKTDETLPKKCNSKTPKVMI